MTTPKQRRRTTLSSVAGLVFALLLGSDWAAALASQDPTDVSRSVTLTRTVSPIVLDGSLDEPDWQSAALIDDLIQREPVEGAAPTERTEVRLLYDVDNLYVGIICYDSDPAAIIGTQMSRDADLSVDDRIEILLDTFQDRRNGFYFATNPAGALVDGLIIENGELNSDWNAVWDVRTELASDGWTVEFAIPFKSLSFSETLDSWGFNVSRTIQRKIEESRWTGARLDAQFVQVSEAGDIRGLADMEQGRGLDVRPFISGSWFRDSLNQTDEWDGDPGVDVFYNVTSGLRLTATINTDFAETEVDDRQINLDRFALFFPEKRSFFLENAGIFDFGISGGFNPTVLPFFSRRIGLLGGEEVPILAGAKLAGKVGRFDVGVLDVGMRETDFAESRNFFVTRIKRNVLNQSYFGMIYTDGNPAEASSARTFGGDLLLSTSNFLGTQRNFNVQAYAMGVRNEGVSGESGAYRVAVAYPNDLWDLETSWLRSERNFDPALGFVPRPDTSRFNVSANFSPRPTNFLGLRQMTHQFNFTRFVRLETGQVESWDLFTAPVNWTFNSGDRFEANWRRRFERLFSPFEISEGVILPPGDYWYNRYRLELFTSDNRPWKVDTTWWFGPYWSGDADELSGQFQYKWAPHLTTALSYQLTSARLPEGNFVARIYSLRADYSVTPFLTFFNLVQFDNESDNLGLQSRVRWIIQPGNDLFFVFNQGWVREDRPDGRKQFRVTGRGLTAKLQYTLRF